MINTKRSSLIGLAIALLLLLCVAYSNHFSNGFEFDDSHTIVNNEYIRDVKNIPLFFTDIKYFGTNPGNQGYRPILVSLNAIDYWLAGGLNPVYFHADIFLSYLILLVLLFFMFQKILDTSLPSDKNKFFALLFTGFYGLHAVNAETINYIIERCDSLSTLCIVAAFLLYMIPKTKKYFLYLIPAAIGVGTKETGAMFGIMLFFYILFFEEKVSLIDFILLKKVKQSFKAFVKSIPALIFSFGLFMLIQKKITSEATFMGGDSPYGVWEYFRTQWVVIVHYIGNFILPLDLSADPDFGIYNSLLDRKVLLCLTILLFLVVVAFITSADEKKRPIAFGILWFFIALAPTSSFLPAGQIANDHRAFFPNIGLVLSLGWWLRLLYLRYEEKTIKHKYIPKIFFTLYLAVISLHAYGTYQRNIIWSSSEKLWLDVTLKSPKNGRGQMNYGLTLMAKGKYEETLPYFKRALELMPYWAYIHINMGILRDAMGYPKEAEEYFLNAIRYQPNVPDSYFFYARFLQKQGRTGEAISQLKKGHEISPGHSGITQYLNSLSAVQGENTGDYIKKIEKYTQENPTAENYIELSLAYYRNGMYKECINACEKALELHPNFALAYNNMCSAYNAMEEWEKAMAACSKAIEIDSNFQLAKNNLEWAKKNLPK
ncbi:MAG: tetratricopeptide repeat protein [Bacteroidetes bacterium]|nr:tetratricopeptide repeat protein [Bacteroidota bacterium]